MTTFRPEEVLDLWFPDDGHQNARETHSAFWDRRMQGGMDAVICDRFGPLTKAAARGLLDHWAGTPRGRLALVIALDQFPRSLWRNTPGAYAQDMKAARLALEGIEKGHFAALAPWERAFFVISISHCEGPDHLERMERLRPVAEALAADFPEALSEMAPGFVAQHQRVTEIIRRFGRHPHRNVTLARLSTPEEESYIAAGDFPHLRKSEPAVG
jgi:uncharacterized protein (DUF924 family)